MFVCSRLIILCRTDRRAPLSSEQRDELFQNIVQTCNLALSNVRTLAPNLQKITRDNAFEIDYRFVSHLSVLVRNEVENSWIKSCDALGASARIYG